jgi:hypothetical protein
VLNSYWVNQDGVYKYYEVILVDPSHKAASPNIFAIDIELTCVPQIRRDPRINWIVNPVHKRREARGLTSIGKQVRVANVEELLKSHFCVESRIRQGPSPQSYSRSFYLEKTQHSQSSPIPLIAACYLHVSSLVSRQATCFMNAVLGTISNS